MPLMLNNEDQERCITGAEAIEAYSKALSQMANGDAMRRPRTNGILPTATPDEWFEFSSMEGGQRGGYYALRVKPNITSTPKFAGQRRLVSRNVRPGVYAGLVFLFDAETAEFVAIMNDGYIQHLRVAASAALGIRALSDPDAKVLGVLGSGGMARSIPLLSQDVRPIERLQIYSPNEAHLETYLAEMETKLAMEIVRMDSPREVCKGADIVLACTNSLAPIVSAEWIEPGTHLNNVLPQEFGPDTYGLVDTMGVLVDRTPMSVGGIVDDGYDFRIRAMSWIAGAEAERNRLLVGSRLPDRCPNARTVLCFDWTTGQSYQRATSGEVTYLANCSNGTLEGDGGASSGLQGLQFAAVGGRIYENARAQGVGSELPLELFIQDIAT